MPEYMRQARDIRRAAIELDAEPPRRWAGPGEVVVFRTDLEAACEFADVEHWNMAPGQRRVFDRLRAVLNTENQT